MFVDVEETLSRELREVADGLQIPAMPALPQQKPRAPRHWQPLLVAASVVMIVAGAVAVVTTTRDGQELQPTPAPSPAPSPSRTESVVEIPTTAPNVPYVLDQRLYVDGVQVPGTWWTVQAGDAGWIALRSDNTWWWGRGPEANKIEQPLDVPPVISPNGRYVAMVADENGRSVATGFSTSPRGEGMGGVPVYPGDTGAGDPVRVRAVTDDGRVIVQGSGTDLLWLPFVDNSTVDLNSTAPGQQVLGSTPGGLVVTDSEGGEPYLAEISDTGELTRTGTIPDHDDVLVSPGALWLVWTPLGTTGGEVTAIPTLEAQTIDGSQQATLTAPAGWDFRVRTWVWEDDDHLVSPVVGDDGERLIRCSVQQARCVLIKS